MRTYWWIVLYGRSGRQCSLADSAIEAPFDSLRLVGSSVALTTNNIEWPDRDGARPLFIIHLGVRECLRWPA